MYMFIDVTLVSIRLRITLAIKQLKMKKKKTVHEVDRVLKLFVLMISDQQYHTYIFV